MNIKKITLSLLSVLFLSGTVKATEFRYSALYAGSLNVMGTPMDLPDFSKWHYFAFDETNGVVLRGTSEFELENITPGKTGTEKINDEWKARTDWDIAFHAYDIRTNSGIAGSGNVGAIFIADTASATAAGTSLDAIYAALTVPPDTIYPADQTVSGTFYLSMTSGMPPTRATTLSVASATRKAAEGATGASTDFSSLSMSDGGVENPMIVVFKTTSGKYVKVYLKQFIEDGKPGFLVFDYEFITLTATGIPNAETVALSVYQDLNSENLNVNLSEKADIAVYNLAGNIVKQKSAQAGMMSIPIADLPKGAYIVKVTSDKTVQTKKIIIK
ncbi:hypothetical protein FACS1894201_00850 [Bacteroidia bacterium]|nr:hypothetical protein FACS1894201_00850 [Bacteroidia bacterium]